MQRKQLFKSLLTLALILFSCSLTFAITTTWQGTVDSDWTNAANWNNGVPTAADDARVIPSANDPEINGTNEKALSLVVRDGAKLTITGAGKLTVELSAANGVVIRDGGEIEVDDGNLNVKNATNNGIRIADGTLTVNANGQVKSEDAGANGILVVDDGTIVNDGDIVVKNADSNGIRNVINNVPAGLIDYSGAGTWKVDIAGSNGILNYITQTPDGEINFQHDGELKVVDASNNGIYNQIENGTGEINFTSNGELIIKSPANITNLSGIHNHLEANSNSEINFKNNAPITIDLGANSNHGIYNQNRNTGSAGLSSIDFDANADITIKNVGGKGLYNYMSAVGPGGAPTANGIRFIFSALLKVKDTGGHGIDNYAQNVGYKRIFIVGQDDSTLEIINAGGKGMLNQAYSSNGSVGQGHVRISLNGTSEIKNPSSRGIDNYSNSGGRIWLRNQGVMTINGGTVGVYNETFNGNVEVINANEAEWYIKNTSGNSVRSNGNGGADREFRNAGCAYMEVDNRIFTDNFLFLNQGILKTTFNGNNTTQGGGYPGEFRNNGLINDPDGVFTANPNGLTGGGIVQTAMPNISVDITSAGGFMFCAGTSVDLAAGEFKILPNTYKWSSSETTQSIAATMAGVYTVTVTDDNGCTATSTVDVTEKPLPIPVFTGNTLNDNTEVCSEEMNVTYRLKDEDPDNKGTYGGAFPKYANYEWSVVGGAISGKGGPTNRSVKVDWPVGPAMGGIFVTVTDATGCTSATSLAVTINPLPIPVFTGASIANGTVCSEATDITYRLRNEDPDNKGSYSGGFPKYANYDWSVVGGTVSGSGAATDRKVDVDWPMGPAMGGVYVTVTDDNGCIAATSIAVSVCPPVLPSITGVFEYCAGASTIIDAGMYTPTPNTYAWSSGATTQSLEANAPGIYTVTVTNNKGCAGTATVDITEHALPVPAFDNSTLNNSLEVCSEATDIRYRLKKEALGSGGTAYGTSNGGARYDDYQWAVNNGIISGAGGATQRTVFADWPVGPTTGEVLVTVTDANGCVADTKVEVTVRAPIMPVITGDFEICPGNPAELDAGAYVYTPNTYVWSTGETTQSISTMIENVYTVTVTDLLGCSGTASVATTDICDPFITGLAHNGATICPGDDVVATVTDYQMMTYGHTYSLTFILFQTNNVPTTKYVDSNATGVFTSPPPGDYTICAYNELTDCQPNPSPNVANLDDLADVGNITDGCYIYECSNITVPELFSFDTDNATLIPNNNTGTNIYVAEFCGGTPPYTLAFSSTPANVFATVSQLPSTSADCRNIQVVFGNGANWSVTVTDSRGCFDVNSVLDSDDVLDPFQLLSINGFGTTNETGIGTLDGTTEVMVSGGDDTCGNYTYQWSGPGISVTNTGVVSGDNITGLATGNYEVIVTDCANNTQVGNVFVNRDGGRGRGRGGRGKTAVFENQNSLMSIAPNPFADYTTIEFATATGENTSIDLFGLNGQLLTNLFEGQTVENELQSINLDGNNLQPGTYIVRLLTESGELKYQKVVLMR